MERYSEYKDSGIYYIPLIPSSWNVLKGKILFKEEKRPIRQQDEIVTCFRDGQVTLRKNRRLEGFTNSLKEIGYQGIRKGDLVIHNMDAFAGAIGVSDSDGKGTPVYAVCTPIRGDVNQYYYCFLLRFLAKIGFIQSLAKGIRERSTDFRYGDFKELLLPVPSRVEQDAIVRYLDAATSKIDKAIAMQQKMIDLLNERKQIIIQNAVTKGLDENVEMKDSGVEWIGMIPKHWKICPFKRLIKIKNGADYKKYEVQDNGFPVIGSGGVFAYSSKYAYDGESLLLGRKGTIDKPMYFKGKFWTVDTMFYGIPKDNADCKYLYYQALTIPFKLYATSTAIPSMTQTDLYNNPMCFPCKEEQKAIADYLDLAIKPFDSAISNCQRQIALLQERKQIIINEVVTGKVKVS